MGWRLMMRSWFLIVIIVVVSLDRHVHLEAKETNPKRQHHDRHELYENDEKSKPASSPYLFPSTFFQDYKKMMSTFKIYPYNINDTINPEHMTMMSTMASCSSLFHTSLFISGNKSSSGSFLTSNPTSAHLFYLPIFPPEMSPRSLADSLNSLRVSQPYWNRSLGADHLFLSTSSTNTPRPGSHRNVVELRKNALQITCFRGGRLNNNYFVPHKDVSLPPYPTTRFLPMTLTENYYKNKRRLGYFKWGQQEEQEEEEQQQLSVLLFRLLEGDPDFVIETELSDEGTYVEMMETSRFCLFSYASDEVAVGLAEAMAYGCVPVIITPDTNRPVNNMPLAGVLRWQDMAVFTSISTSTSTSTAVDVDRFKKLLISKDYPMMRGLVVQAAKHLLWNEPPRPYDAFHMVMYQLWTRRHAVRYY